MKRSNVVVGLSSLVALLALVAAGAGLFWPGEGSPFTFTTLRGQTVEIYGQGLYPMTPPSRPPSCGGPIP